MSTDSPIIEARRARLTDQAAAPLLAGLLHEYTTRYGPKAAAEFERHPAEVFAPEVGGAVVLLVEEEETVAGGALRRFEPEPESTVWLAADPDALPTAEFKRIWTHPDRRRRGLARRVLTELEDAASEAGYRRIFLTTGPRQPEAVALYLAAGYTELSDPGAAGRGYPVHPFVKTLDPR
ncbi:MAG TPA: GNAT family N-acetyltransferase [Actinocrinis sp.]|nr:GNAT family N-acetyltransferase [Actinocrinis sp.]